MKGIIDVRNMIIVILCITIILLGGGFAYVSMQIEDKKEEVIFDVAIVSVEQMTAMQGGINKPKGTYNISNSGKTVDFLFNIYASGDEVCYKVVIKNNGNMPVRIVDLVEIPDYLNDVSSAQKIYPVKISHDDINGKKIAAGEEIELKVVAYLNSVNKELALEIPYQINILTEMIK